MAKKESTLKNMLIALMVIAIVSGGVLGFVYGLTNEKIDFNKKEKNESAIYNVLNLKKENKPVIKTIDHDTLVYNLAYTADNQFIGAAIKTYSLNGFGGKIELMIGILANDNINKVSVLSQAETPGLGANMSKDGNKLMNSINNKSIDSISTKTDNGYSVKVNKGKDKGKVDALTAATISSRAVCEAVEKAVNGFMANKDQFLKGGNNE